MALIFSNFLWPPEPLLQYPCARAQGLHQVPFLQPLILSERVRPREGTEVCNFGVPSPLDFLIFSNDFPPSLQVHCVISKESTPKCGENCPISGRRKSRSVGSSTSAIRTQCGENVENAEGPSHPREEKKNKGLRRFHGAENVENADTKMQKMPKTPPDWLYCDWL